ncbi:LD-carboxypeptidase [Candidatus Williamhamiltonella defendens]|uniref:LD-carboxypeptidase family protein n=1 Tax=Hamiltonella defensa subsp. Acyrthosiphon pisum (strain 5AT) TaxID=572265 RepID=C4K4N3_HAMD5|nr:LD-carboxypeptidase [Candidatus Hamiltonella defensa]ACQ67526.1 LD-carboxypeptidase family protein [Candidatus Hamiltonella defensa 5AT (Acyrthosiphon pisum)]ATW22234.1 LD-carboxypeptidase [Candidatus Hamiltonella defensa]
MKRFCIFIFLLSFIFSFQLAAQEKSVIHLISSSTEYNEEMIPGIIKMFEEEGYVVDTRYLNQQTSDFGYVNTDKSRAKTLISALVDDNVKYLWFIRGGAGAINLLPYLEDAKDKIKKSSPKIIVGFSDVTAIHHFINKYIMWPSIHGVFASSNKNLYVTHDQEKSKMNMMGMNTDVKTIFSATKNGVEYNGIIPLNDLAMKNISGKLFGGNLTLIKSLFSTKYEKSNSHDIIIMEDTNGDYRQLDRSLHQLIYRNEFKPKGIIFGQFYSISANDEERLIFKTVIKNFAAQAPYPVYYYPFFGHGKTNHPFIFLNDVKINCEIKNEYCSLKQEKMVWGNTSK